MRQPKPYYKESHRAWYANIGPSKRPVRLASQEEGEAKAYEEYHALMAARQPIQPACRVLDLVQRFIDHHKQNSAPRTVRFYFEPLDSFTRFLGPDFQLRDLTPFHVTEWLDRCHRTIKRAKKTKGTYVTTDTGKPITDNTRRNLIRAVKSAFRWAEDQEYIDRSPMRKVKVPSARPRDVYLMPDQWKTLVATVKNQAFLDYVDPATCEGAANIVRTARQIAESLGYPDLVPPCRTEMLALSVARQLLSKALATISPPESGPLTVREAAERLGVSIKTIYDHVEKGRLRCTRIGRAVRIQVSDLDRIAQLNIEHAGPGQTDAGNAWQATVHDVNDPGNLGIADINYWVVLGNVGVSEVFTRNGGTSIRARRVGSAPAGNNWTGWRQ